MYLNQKSLLGQYSKNEDDDDNDDKNNDDKQSADKKIGLLNEKMEKLFFSKRNIYLWGGVDDKSAKEIVTKFELLELDDPTKEINFFINSPGGVVTSGMVIYDTIKYLSCPVSTICIGLAASMGSVLLSCGVKGRRFIYPHAEVMIHQPSLGGYFQATSADIEIHAEQIKKTKEISAKILADNCGKSLNQILKDFDRDYWMNAQEAIEYGIVDGVYKK
ncbi:MAG: ATP-dependent Clp protease proteolytic subunit [Phycisphaerales bacterium]|nr:ATP-dependent Clp protease proteolytic subunit [Phycisphaerales bacterium]